MLQPIRLGEPVLITTILHLDICDVRASRRKLPMISASSASSTAASHHANYFDLKNSRGGL
jgi:hypothetical protein